jgi:hypothetical protein
MLLEFGLYYEIKVPINSKLRGCISALYHHEWMKRSLPGLNNLCINSDYECYRCNLCTKAEISRLHSLMVQSKFDVSKYTNDPNINMS